MTLASDKKTDSSYSSNSANALIHLYRAEVGRMTSYRQRLDMTTNWAVVTSAGIASFAFSNEVTHAVFLFAMFMNYFFLHLESRRFRQYEIAHHRVRIMERFFYPAMLGDPVDGSWHQVLLGELAKPMSPMRRIDAMGWRLRRNYLWLYSGILIVWVTKVDTARLKGEVYSFSEYLELYHVGNIHGWIIVLFVVLFYVVLINMAVYASRYYPLESD